MANDANGTVTLTVPSPKEAKPPVRFVGKSSAKVATSTNQVTLPKAFKNAVEAGDEGILMLVPNDDVAYWQLYTEKAFLQLVENTRNDPNLQENNMGDQLAEDIAVSAMRVEWDTQGRFVLCKEFTSKLGAEKNEVVFTGGIGHLKLWTESDYIAEQEKSQTLKNSDQYKAAKLGSIAAMKLFRGARRSAAKKGVRIMGDSSFDHVSSHLRNYGENSAMRLDQIDDLDLVVSSAGAGSAAGWGVRQNRALAVHGIAAGRDALEHAAGAGGAVADRGGKLNSNGAGWKPAPH